ncbi:hypothetical protein SOVF_025770 [Spinacia oleracea]|nr:hypothetical protein SOVF_025770 [Spinacia oleracea]
MPIIRESKRYNCQVICMNRKIMMIRPKMWLANDGNYRELRWFTAWKQKHQMVDFQLPTAIADAISQYTVPFGYGFIQFLDTVVAAEICEELFSPVPPHAELALNGVEVFMNSSGSHHQLRKLDLRMRGFIGATLNRGGLYMYSNHQGCDGGRLYYDGCCCIVVNGDVVAQGSQFSLKDVEVVVAQVDLDVVDGGSNAENLGLQNIQARLRMVLAFMLASLMPWVHKRSGFYLVLSSTNVDEALRGNLTKNLCFEWGSRLTPSEVGEKVKFFFKHYSINRHKMTVLTPSYHAESYSPEDNRFDMRQFLYNSTWPFQFRKIDELVKKMNGNKMLLAESDDKDKPGLVSDHVGGMIIGSGNCNGIQHKFFPK